MRRARALESSLLSGSVGPGQTPRKGSLQTNSAETTTSAVPAESQEQSGRWPGQLQSVGLARVAPTWASTNALTSDDDTSRSEYSYGGVNAVP